MRVIVFEGKVFESKRVDITDGRIDTHGGKGARITSELQPGLVEVVRIQMQVSKAMEEVTGFKVEHLCNHHGEKRVARDVEGNPQKEVGTTLVELAGQAGASGLFPRLVDVELEEEVAGWKRHLVDLAHVPCGDNVTAGMRSVAEIVQEACDLVDRSTLLGFPGPPLLAIDGSQITVFICPLIPDPDIVFLKVADISAPHQEPEEFVDDGTKVKLLGSQAGKSLAEVIADLSSEDRARAGARSVCALFAVFEHVAEQVQVLPHRGFFNRERMERRENSNDNFQEVWTTAIISRPLRAYGEEFFSARAAASGRPPAGAGGGSGGASDGGSSR